MKTPTNGSGGASRRASRRASVRPATGRVLGAAAILAVMLVAVWSVRAEDPAIGDTIYLAGVEQPLRGVYLQQIYRRDDGTTAVFWIPPPPSPELAAALRQPGVNVTPDPSGQGRSLVAGVVRIDFGATASAPAPAGPIAEAAEIGHRVSRVRAGMRSFATALESFHIDTNTYPLTVPGSHPDSIASGSASLANRPTLSAKMAQPDRPFFHLTSPISYIRTYPEDAFSTDPGGGTTFSHYNDGEGWILISPGPDRVFDFDPVAVYRTEAGQRQAAPPAALLPFIYDPTNGIVSGGDIIRIGE